MTISTFFRWDSDEEVTPLAPSEKRVETKVNPASKGEKPFTGNHIKSRKIRIKKPGENISPAVFQEKEDLINRSVPVKGPSESSNIYSSDSQSLSSSLISPKDRRHVVVSSAGKSTVEENTSRKASKEARTLRPSVSNIDEAMFEPDYNDEENEKALSNYAPSDIEEQMSLSEKGSAKEISVNSIVDKSMTVNAMRGKGADETSKKQVGDMLTSMAIYSPGFWYKYSLNTANIIFITLTKFLHILFVDICIINFSVLSHTSRFSNPLLMLTVKHFFLGICIRG